MSDGYTHFGDSIAVTIAFPAIVGAWQQSVDIGVFVLAGCVFASFFTPDDDLGRETYPAHIVRRYTPILATPFGLIKRPYYGMFRRHRGMSHWPIVGTLGRMVVPFCLVVIVRYLFGPVSLQQDMQYSGALFWFFLGAVAVDTPHELRDYFGKGDSEKDVARTVAGPGATRRPLRWLDVSQWRFQWRRRRSEQPDRREPGGAEPADGPVRRTNVRFVPAKSGGVEPGELGG